MSDEDCQTVQCAMKRGRQKCRKKSKRKKQRERRCQQYEMSDSDDNEINMCGKAARCATRAFRRMGPVNTRAGTTCSSEISELNQAKQCGKCSSLPSDDRKVGFSCGGVLPPLFILFSDCEEPAEECAARHGETARTKDRM